MKKHIFVVIPTFNEEENIQNLFDAIQTEIFKLKDKYRFSLLFIDNSSKDESITILRDLASKYKFVKVIINNKNYGHIRSPYYGILQSEGDATIYMASDFQDPPELINKLIDKWEKGSEVVFCQKNKVSGNFLLEKIRSAYYKFLKKISGIEIVSDATGFGIYDKKVIDKIKEINDPLPFFRGLIVELGFKIDIIKFNQPNRNSGISKNNLYTLFDYAIHGMVSHSTLPLRLITLVSIPAAIISFVMALCFLILKLFFWHKFQFGFAPLIISILLLFSLVFIAFAILGEYLAHMRIYIRKRPVVVEKERINFDEN